MENDPQEDADVPANDELTDEMLSGVSGGNGKGSHQRPPHGERG